ncbi:hypothetical protein ACI7BZ_00670 [Xanthobacter sp. AM11]|uniref:hypothetical protein n=1 Tax=Xanthobacter sp. AM11 TaxID=3380643 RepID=UPI0039BEFC3D
MSENRTSAAPPPAAEGAGGAERGPRPQLLVALFAAAVVAFNFPMLIVWDADATVFGLPLLPVALFTIWGGFIAALAVASERRPRPAPDVLPPAAPRAGGGP